MRHCDVVCLRGLGSTDLLGELVLQVPDLLLILLPVHVEVIDLLLSKLAIKLNVLELLPEALDFLIFGSQFCIGALFDGLHLLAALVRCLDFSTHRLDCLLHLLHIIVLATKLIFTLLPDHRNLCVKRIHFELELGDAPGVLTLVAYHLLVLVGQHLVLLLVAVYLRL